MLSVRYRVAVVLLLVTPLTGCLFRSRPIPRPVSTAPLKSATQPELIQYINKQAELVHSMQATVDIDTTVGGVKKGVVTDYQQIRGYVLARKPAMLRMIGLMPIVRNRAFDMVSDGQIFKLWVPPKNRFVVGRNDVETHNEQQPLENLRPKHIYDALLLREVAPDEIAVLENDVQTITDAKGRKTQQDDYVVDIIGNDSHGHFLSRKIVFSRVDLLPYRQLIYDEDGRLATDAHYEGYKDYAGVNFPSRIQIMRPQEEYDIVLSIVKLKLNEDLPNDKFQLDQPAGAQVVRLAPQAQGSHGGGGKGE